MPDAYQPHPLRIQRRRTKGWKMPEGAVYVGRPTAYGNPWCDAETFRRMLTGDAGLLINTPLRDPAVRRWRDRIMPLIVGLRGKQLACWCPLDRPCHADVLAELANQKAPT